MEEGQNPRRAWLDRWGKNLAEVFTVYHREPWTQSAGTIRHRGEQKVIAEALTQDQAWTKAARIAEIKRDDSTADILLASRALGH